jgi:hypothetical protein
MRRIAIEVGAMLLLATAFAGCGSVGVRGSGNPAIESREVSGFSEIVLKGAGRLVVDVTGTESLTIEADDNLLPLITSEVVDGRLVLDATSSIAPTTDIIHSVTVKTLHGVHLDGSGDIVVSALDASDFDASIGGSGDVELSEIDVGRLDARIEGSGEIIAAGSAEQLDVSISGSGTFSGERLESFDCSVDISGSGDATVFATSTLAGSISGSGDITYFGDPRLDSDIAGSGELRPGRS